MTLLYDELRDAVVDRSVSQRTEPSGRTSHALTLRFSTPPSPQIVAQLQEEARHAASVRIPGMILPIGLEFSPSMATLLFTPIDPDTLRLDTLQSALRWMGSPLGSPLSAWLIVELATTLQSLHNQVAPDGTLRVHRELHSGSVFIGQGGEVSVLGCGMPLLSAVMLPRLPSEADRYRLLAPEAARGQPLDPRSDVYSLGILYYELLTGRPYRESHGATSICQIAIEGHPPDLPGALPDPRPGLISVLTKSLAPDADQRFQNAYEFGEAVLAELAGARIQPGEAQLLRRMVDEYVPAGVERGEDVLLSARHDEAAFEALMDGNAQGVFDAPDERVQVPDSGPTSAAPPSRELVQMSIPDGGTDPWSRVLGGAFDEATPDPDARPSEPTTPAPSASSSRAVTLPLPEDTTPSTKPLPKPIAPDPALSQKLAADLTKKKPTSARSFTPVPEAGPARGPMILKYGALVLAACGLLYLIQVKVLDPPQRDPNRTRAVLDMPDTGTRPPPPPTAADAGTTKTEAKPLGLLTVLSKPSGASVELDGGYIGKTPLVLRHEFERRTYLLRVLADGHVAWERRVAPDPKKGSISVMAIMEKK